MFDTMVDEMIGTAAAREANTVLRELETMAPGPFMAIVLSGINLDDLTGDDRVTVVQARQRMASHYTAETYEAMASVVDAYQDEFDAPLHDAAEAAAYELRAALCLTRRAADTELSLALDLRDRHPRVFDALSAGLIDRRRAGTIVWQTTHLTDDEARLVVDRIIDQAPDLTTGQLMARIRKLCAEVDADSAQKRYRQTIEDRKVVMDPTVMGTANLCLYDLEPDKAVAAGCRINEIARSLRSDGETRTMDQLRADVAIDLLLGTNAAKGGTIDLHVDLDTLVELNERPGHLGGYGPVISDIARKLTDDSHDAQWRYTVTDQGRPIAVGTTRRRPSAAQRRLVEATYPTCIFPGCRIPARRCDIDHRIDWVDAGRTNTDDLAPACSHDHHGAKHKHGWTYRLLPNGVVEWTSPLGHTYSSRARDP